MATTEPDLSEFGHLEYIEALERINTDLLRKLKRAKAKIEDLVEATLEASRDAMLSAGPLPKVAAPKLKHTGGKPEVALWHLTDWHSAKVTTSYNLDVMRERALRYTEKAAEFTALTRSHHPVKDCVIMFGGDGMEGLFNFPQQPFEIDATLFGQFTAVSRVYAEVVRCALSLYDKVTVIGEWGNHGRVGDKRAVVPRADNFDRMTYHLVREVLSGESRLSWDDCPEDIQHVEIGNYRALLIHGDEFGRSGYVAWKTLVGHVADWKSGAHPWPFKDCYVGHYHCHREEPLPDGDGVVFGSGSLESDSRYARDRLAKGAIPSQRLHFISPSRGEVTSQYKVRLL